MAVFLSYSRKDDKAVNQLYEFLCSKGLEVWKDNHDLYGGEELHPKIKDQIKASDHILPVFSENSIVSGWFHQELLWAYSNRVTTIPVLLNKSFDLKTVPHWLFETHAPFIQEQGKILKAITRNTFQECRDRGRSLNRKGDLSGAIDCFVRALKIKPEASLAVEIAELHARQKNDEGVLDATDTALKMLVTYRGSDKNDLKARVYLLRGCAARRLNEIDTAIDVLSKAAKLSGNSHVAFYELGKAQLLAEMKSYRSIASSFRQSRRLVPEDALLDRFAISFDTGKILFQMANTTEFFQERDSLLEEAKTCFKDANSAKPGDRRVHFALGYAYHQLQKFPQAVDNYRKAANGKFYRALYCEGCVHFQTKNFPLAIQCFESAELQFKKKGWSRDVLSCQLGLGRSYLALGKNELALKFADQAFLNNKFDLRAVVFRAESLAANNRVADAISLLSQLLNESGGSCVNAHEILARLHGESSKLGKIHSESAKNLRKSRRMWPGFGWGMGYSLAGNTINPLHISARFDVEAAVSQCALRGWKCGENKNCCQ